MVKNYDDADIIEDYPTDWEERVGKYIPNRDYILTSPVKRCIQTCNLLFKKDPTGTVKDFGEFDCSGIGKRKFWEMTEKQFELTKEGKDFIALLNHTAMGAVIM